MTAITFPNSPSSGDTHSAGNGVVYIYDGEKWTSAGTNGSGAWTQSGAEVSLTNAGDDLNIDSGTLFVDASTDRVGINTSSPNTNLEIGTASGNNTSIKLNSSTNDYLEFSSEGTIGYIIAGHPTTGSVELGFKISGGAGPVEAARIDSSGRFGLGESSPAAKLDVNGNQTSNVVAMAALDVDCSAGNYFTKTIYGNSTFTFSNVPSSRSFSFVLELTHSSGTVTWPSSVKFPLDTAPTLTTGKTHLFVFVTDDGGSRFRGAALVDYVN